MQVRGGGGLKIPYLVVELAHKVRTPDENLQLTLSDLKGLKTLYQMETT